MTTSVVGVRSDKNNAADFVGQCRSQGIRKLPRGRSGDLPDGADHRGRRRQGGHRQAVEGRGNRRDGNRLALPWQCLSGGVRGADWRGVVGRARVSEEIDPRDQDAEARDRLDRGQGETVEGDVAMKHEPLEVLRGSGNVYRDLGQDDADVKQFKALLAAEIIKALDKDGLTVRAAHARTGIAAADFSRIRNADLTRFTLDRLVGIINRLGARVEVKLRVKPTARAERTAMA